MRARIHKIHYEDKVYFKVYAENLNGRMVLMAKNKFETLREAKDFAKVMIPTHVLDAKVKEVKF